MTTVGPVPPPLPTVPTPTATTNTANAVSTGATPTPAAATETATAVQALTAVIVNLPNTLRTRPPGSPITGTLVAQASDGTAVIKTNEGVVVLRGPVNAPVGTQLSLALPDQPAEGSSVRLTPLRQPDGGAVGAVTRGPNGPVSGPGSGGPSIGQGPATIFTPTTLGSASNANAAAASLTPGQVVTATLAQRTGATAQQAGYASAPIGATFSAKVLSVLPPEAQPGQGIAMGVTREGHPVVTATVIGRTGMGMLVVNAGFGLLTIPAGGEAAPGARLQLEMLAKPPGDPAPRLPSALPDEVAAETQPAGDAGTLAHDWQTLRQAMDTLIQHDPQAAQSALGRVMAQPGDRFAAGLLVMMTAMRGGNVQEFLGEGATRSLEKAGRGGLLRRLGEELTIMNKLATEPTGDWRAFFLPVLPPDGPVTPVRLYYRQPQKKKGQPDTATRFVVETELSNLGPLQIDGLARAQRLDLILRTRAPLPPDAQQEIDRRFQSAAADGRFAGTIAFQAVQRFPIDPLEEIGHPVHGVVA